MNLANICYFFLMFSHFTYYIVLGIGMHAYAEALGNGFWARDITFRNTTGLEKEQAVAMRVSSNHSIFYRCSFEASQDTLYVESNLQFYARTGCAHTIVHVVCAQQSSTRSRMGYTRSAHTRSPTRCAHSVSHAVRTRGLARGRLCTWSRTRSSMSEEEYSFFQY